MLCAVVGLIGFDWGTEGRNAAREVPDVIGTKTVDANDAYFAIAA